MRFSRYKFRFNIPGTIRRGARFCVANALLLDFCGVSTALKMNEQNTSAETNAPLDYRGQRIANLEKLRELGYEPFGRAFRRTGTIADVRAMWTPPPPAPEGSPEPAPEAPAIEVTAAGRLMASRKMGKTIFADLRDGTGKIQLFVNGKNMADGQFDAFKLLDLGDHIGVSGTLFTTHTGELSIRVSGWTLLSKGLLPPPEKFHGLQDQEDRYRYRYIDLTVNPESRDRFNKRVAIVREFRRYLEDRGFQEVETPMMQPQPGGAAARPFTTHYNALDCTMYMRIAPELYLKRLIVGGFDKVFELGRDFRNEGLDRTHNPEFTVLEIYQAYGDRDSMRDIIEGALPRICDNVLGTRKVVYEGKELDFTPPYRVAEYEDLVKERMGADWYSLPLAEQQKKCDEAKLPYDPSWDSLLLTHEVYDKLIEKTLFQPTFVVHMPHEFVPLAKTVPGDPTKAEAFEFVVGGRELCPGYTEQNDPFAQREAFEHQAGEDTEKVDEDFIRAIEFGMPPTGGMGMGIDRLVMMLTGTDVIRDVILFPQLKPEAK